MDQPAGPSRWRALLPGLAILAAVGVLVTAHIAAYRKISPFDEGVHFDYVVKAGRGEIIGKGERLGQLAMSEMACRGVDIRGLLLPPCDSEPFEPAAFPNDGYNSADIHPPVYYGITGVLARGLVAVRIAPDLFTAARLVGILWLGLGLAAIWYLGRDLGIGSVQLGVVLGTLAGAPTLLHASATVTNDATGVLAGAALVWAALRWERERGSPWVVGLIAFLAISVKTTNIVTVGVLAFYLLLRPRAEEPARPRSNRWTAMGAMLGGTAAALVLWGVIHAAASEAVVTPIDEYARDLDLPELLSNLTMMLTPVNYGLPTYILGSRAFDTLGGVLAVLIIAATLHPVLRGSYADPMKRLAASGGLAMLFGGAAFAVMSYAVFGAVIVSPRYGLSLIPVLVVALASAIRSRAVLWGLGAFAVGQFALVLGRLLTV